MKMDLDGSKLLMLSMLAHIFFIHDSEGLTFSKTARTYAKFPKWNACVHASISFEFKTNLADSLLMYTDDNGKYDYVEILLKDGSVRLRMNIVDGRDKGEQITLGQGLNDNRWHSVELKRNRMESTLYVDQEHASAVAFGSDFNFGELSRNNFVYFGGLPFKYHTKQQNNLPKLSLPSAFYEPRFDGEIRNVVYYNCTCKPSRGEMIEGDSVSRVPLEACEKNNTCGNCLCVSQDLDSGCQCKGLECEKDVITHYILPMDEVYNDTLVNPSGLDSKVTGSPLNVPGVVGKAVKIDEKFQRIIVSGPGHRKECFGDLDLCPQGYTLALWIRFDKPGPGQGVYISNGGQSAESHGVAMLYRVGYLEWIFKTKGSGLRWSAKATNILPRHWYHVMAMWHAEEGLSLFINGNKVAHSGSPDRVTTAADSTNNDFIIGQPNDGTGSADLGTITIDEFQFWSTKMEDNVLREKGPIYKHSLSMDQLENGQLVVPFLEPKISGVVRQVPGKIGTAVELPGKGEHIDLGSFADSCLGNTTLCKYGLTVTFWVNFNDMKDHAYIMSSGLEGFSIFSFQRSLCVTVQEEDRSWATAIPGLRIGTWYFLEISWSRTSGLRVFINRKLTSVILHSAHWRVQPSYFNRFYIGRANTIMNKERYADASFDEIELFNAERERLLAIDFIQRARPDKTYIGFDRMVGTKIDHPNIVIETYGGPSLVPGKIFQALRLNGSAQTAEFNHGDGCLGNLDYCLHGVLLCLWIRPEKYEEGMFYLSSGINGISLSRIDRKLRVQVQTTTLLWEVFTTEVTSLDWHYIEISWDPETGLKLYSDNKVLVEDIYPEENTNTHSSSQLVYDKFILGKHNGGKTGSQYGAATYDEMEFWLGSREYLLAFNYIQRGQPTYYRIGMDLIFDQGRRLAHPVLPIMIHGNASLVTGVLGKAVHLNNMAQNGQYIDIGDQTDKCLGNIQKCQFGITVSFWIKIDNYYNNMYIFSTGLEGIRIYYQTGYIYFRIDQKDKTWRVTIPKLRENKWHLLELSWHVDYGIYVYVDKELSAHAQYRSIAPVYQTGSRNFYIGAWNSGDNFGQHFSYGNLAIDEFEIWYQRREVLLALGYIIRDYVEFESFSMEIVTSGNIIFHPRYHVTLEQGARLVPGKIGNAVLLEGKGQYVDLGEHMDKCMANLDLCKVGLTITLWLNPEQVKENSYYLTGPMYSLYFKDGKLKSKFTSRGKVWNVETNRLDDNAWTFVMLSWDRDDGLKMYLDNWAVDVDLTPKDVMLGDQPSSDDGLYIGRSASGITTRMLADEVQYWYANIDQLVAQGLYGFPVHEVVPISRLVQTGKLTMGSRTISIRNGATFVNGQHDKAIKLDGKTQYIDLGANLTCGGNLDNCHQGFSLRFSTKPDKLVNYMYFIDSFPISIFYKDNRLYATARTSTQTWTVAAPGFKKGEWQLVDVSWHPEIGLTMHVNDADVGSHKTDGTATEPVYVIDPRTYFGRSLSGQIGDRYAATSLENFEVWNVRRDVLVANGGGTQFITPKPEVTKNPPVDTSPTQDDGTRIFVTNLPNGTTQVIGGGLDPTSTTSAIRFFGESWVRYDFRNIMAEMLDPAINETLSFKFITRDASGLIWMLKGTDGKKAHLSMQNGALLFVIDDGIRTPQQIVLRNPRGGLYNDGSWYTFKVERKGRNLKFYINNQYIMENTTRMDVQFVSRGDFWLGGSPDTRGNTEQLINSNFDGGVTDLEVRKLTSPQREIIIRFLQLVGSAEKTGEVEIIEPDRLPSYIWFPVITTPTPDLPTPVTFTSASSVVYLKDALDMRRDGSIKFRFRTLEPRGLLAISRGRLQGSRFIAIEIFDGILYFVYDFGSFSSRKVFSARRVDDGEWHEVKMMIDGTRMTIALDGRDIVTPLDKKDVDRLVFGRLYVGGFDNIANVPWLVYSRIGYRGCLESLKVNGIGVDLHSLFKVDGVQGVEMECRPMARFCQTQPCDVGDCKDVMDNFECYCPNTYFTGQKCDTRAYTLSMDGTTSANYQFLNRETTHTNDLSLRFLTPLSNTLLFTTEADNRDDFIKAELEQGVAKITVRVDGKTKTFVTGRNLNDYQWHTLYLRRRADDVEVWVDDEERKAGVIGGEGYQLMIDRIKFGSLGSTSSLSSNNYIGLMQNFIYDKIDVFSQMRPRTLNKLIWISGVSPTNIPIPVYKPITVTSSSSYFRLPAMRIGRTMKLMFKFRTREPNGLIMYSKGNGNDAFAVEMSNGQVRLAYNLGGRNMHSDVPTVNKLNDNTWHTVQISLNENGQFSVKVDDGNLDVSTSDGDGRLDLSGSRLYIAGLPEAMFSQPDVMRFIKSKKGFRGCLASMDLNGAVPDLLTSNYASDKKTVVNGCTDLTVDCKPGMCGPGTCVPSMDNYLCDCNMTGYVGSACREEPIGYYFGKNDGKGIVIYSYPHEILTGSAVDRIAFGFMTKRDNGVLYRIESALDDKEFIEIRLEDGYIIADSNTGGGVVTVSESSRKFNDGGYHTVRYIRTGQNSTLQVNSLPAHTAVNTGIVSLFDKVHTVILGGRTNAKGQQVHNFNGIIGGAYYNDIRWFDLLYGGQQLNGKLVQMRGDVVLAGKPFLLVAGGAVTPKPTAGPPPINIPPDSVVAGDIGGSGFAENPPSGTGGGGGIVGIGDVGGIHTIPGAIGINVAGGGGPGVAAASTLLGPGPPPIATGARAGVVVGTLLGTLAFLSSLMWALYKLKPGVPSFLSPGAGAVAGGGDGMVISAPRTTSNLAAVQAASGGGGAGGGAGAGAGKVTVVNGAAAGGGGAGGGSSTYTSYFQSTSASVGGGGGAGGAGGGSAGGADQFDSATLRATGTFSNKGTTIGTPGAVRSNMGSSSSYSANYQTNTLQSNQSYGSGQASPGMGGGMGSSSYSDRQYLAAGDNIPDYDLPVAGTMQSGHSYSSSTLNTHYNYQANNTNTQAQHHKSVLTIILAGNRPASPVPIRHEIYTPALAASGEQAYVDRSEDLIIEQPRSLVFVKPSLTIEDTNVGNTSAVTLKTGKSAQVSYSAQFDSNTYSSMVDVSPSAGEDTSTNDYLDLNVSVPSANTFSGDRKASLQIFPKSGKAGYQRLENSSSESNVSVLTSTGNARSKKDKYLNVSHDNMYESTNTVTSSVYSESAGASLSNLEEETSFGGTSQDLDSFLVNFANFNTDLSTDLGEFSVETSTNDNIYAKVDKSKKTSNVSTKVESSIEMKDFALDSPNQQEQQSSMSVKNQTGGSQTDRAETVIEFQRPTFSKQTSKTSSNSITINVSGGLKDVKSTESYQVAEFSSSTSTTSKNTHVSKTDEDTTMIITLEDEAKSTGTVAATGRDLNAELDSSMNVLLSGIDVDTSKWDALKDVSGYNNTGASDNWEVQNLKTVTINRQGQYVMSGGAVTPGAAADEVRVDCCLITGDGSHVVTGSTLGPPQVWDMQSGELQNIMKGDTVGSTGLHLVCGDRLLVGAVHADMEINEYSGRKGVFNHHLQIWDFVTGKPLSMAEGEYCSALCTMSDNDKVIFGRTDKFGDATSIIAWDLMGNQMIKEMRYDAPLGNNDYISYLNLSKNDRFVVAGYTNSFDNCAEFMTYDMTLTSYNINEPAMLKLDANPECTAILPKDEAVTGLRNGDLVIWSIRSAQPSRQLLGSGGSHAHSREVKCVTLSKDGKYLVSGAADGTLKVWDMHTERPVHTLNGHTDEVWCSAISDDNEIVVSGSSDGTIRLWRMKNGSEMCVFNCGVDIFSVAMSHDKGTIVALGDKFGARKLIMLQVVRTKIKKIVSS